MKLMIDQILKKQQLRQGKSTQTRSGWSVFVRGFYAVWIGIFLWIGLIIFYPPRVSVNPIGSEKPGEALQPKFEISNNSTFPIYDVSSEATWAGRYGGNEMSAVHMALEPTIRQIEAGSRRAQALATSLHFTPLAQDDFVDVTVVTKFRSSFVWWHSVIKRRFLGRRMADNSVKWMEIPLSY